MDELQRYTLYKRVARIGLPVMIVLLLASIALLAYSQSTTGELFQRDISLAGGATISFSTSQDVTSAQVQQAIKQDLGETVRVRETVGATADLVIEARIQNQTRIDNLVDYVSKTYGVKQENIAVDFIGATLGASFFAETFKALIVAFILMGLSILLIFRKWLPAFYVILAAFADIVMTIAVVNLTGIQVSTGGLAAFLMLLGYSVDTDILLTTKMLKKQREAVEHRFDEAFRTGITMSMTSLIAVVIGAIVTNSSLIQQIMTIIAIGLVFDMLNTWLTNGQLVVMQLDKEASR